MIKLDIRNCLDKNQFNKFDKDELVCDPKHHGPPSFRYCPTLHNGTHETLEISDDLDFCTSTAS
ncbi:hypothetical protein SADUNF_Sadunf03G0119600 [Salix dunnii]|uniref:Uncharacterized protein n=1 Tax=Salix dunnii TaxID=1413687 RepID=A0A835N4F2_9ROSI|nr:hypothetical protein SADUNF_Sadunf03G0119600 [Salix dunnii]